MTREKLLVDAAAALGRKQVPVVDLQATLKQMGAVDLCRRVEKLSKGGASLPTRMWSSTTWLWPRSRGGAAAARRPPHSLARGPTGSTRS